MSSRSRMRERDLLLFVFNKKQPAAAGFATLSMTGTLFQQLANLIRISSGFWWPMQYSHYLVVGL